MKATIDFVKFKKEYDSRFGKLYLFEIVYGEKKAYYSSKSMEQTNFVEGKEAEFTEETRTGDKGEYLVIKPMSKGRFSGYAKELKKEQSRYSGFAVSYVKDLIIANKIHIDDWEKASKKIFDFMVSLDKSLQDDKN